jgi:outer membrane protein assembly factor BamB
MIKVVMISAMFALFPYPVCAGTLLDVIDGTGARNGIIVLVQAGDTVCEDAAASGFAVLALDTRPDRVDTLRRRFLDHGLYGRVSASLFDGKSIPCIDELVNVVVIDGINLSDEEIMRVLVPGGVALVRNGNDWRKRLKPWPTDIDEWSQYLRNADNNAVSRDRVGPPERLKWTGGTRWGRSHMSAVTVISMVTAGGRLYTIEDLETPEYHSLPGRYFLIVRDAFNGMKLWQRPLEGIWPTNGYPKFIATQIQRRIAAIGDKLYCLLGTNQPISVLDGASGEVLKRYENTSNTQEFAYDAGILYVAVGEPFGDKTSRDTEVRLLAVEAATGKTLWTKQITDDGGYLGGTMSIRNEQLAYCTKTGVICADARTGDIRWRAEHNDLIPTDQKASNNVQPTLVLSDDMLFCSTHNQVRAFPLKDGHLAWAAKNSLNYMKSSDIFLAQGLVWTGLLNGHDPEAGRIVRTLEQKMQGPMSHDRCYRNRITEQYLINSKTGGSDFIRLDGRGEFPAPWVRATCGLGVLPANGLLYSSPYSCTCVSGTMLTSYNALYDQGRSTSKTVDLSPQPQLFKGPAFGARDEENRETSSDDWPTYRNTNARSGVTRSSYEGKLEPAWQARLSSSPTAPIIVDDLIFIAAKDAHTLYALSRTSGKIDWSFVADGRIDSPPTYYRGLLLFGCRGGWAYALRATDGALAWKFSDLPDKRLISAQGQLESAWPISGSVTVHDRVAYFAAGRQTFIDGGIVLYGLNPLTGDVLHRRRISGPYDDQGFPRIRPLAGIPQIEGFKSGIFSAEKGLLYLRHQAFRPDLTPVAMEDIEDDHLIASAGFLDDTPQHRTYWSIDTDLRYGPANAFISPGPQGDIAAVDGDVFYEIRGYLPGRHAKLLPANGYTLYSGTRSATAWRPPKKGKPIQLGTVVPLSRNWKQRWSTQIPLSGHALIVAGDTVLAAGVPMEASFGDPELSSSFAGQKGGRIWAARAKDGAKIAFRDLPAPPVWDGLAAARGNCVIALKDGTVLCLR